MALVDHALMKQFRGLSGTVGGIIEGGPNCRYEARRHREMAELLLTLHHRFGVAGLVRLPRPLAHRRGWRAWVRAVAMWLLVKSGHEVVEPVEH